MTIGVVIVNYNNAKLALDAALSVLGDHAEARVVIVDNGSTDQSPRWFQSVADKRERHNCQEIDGPCAISFADAGNTPIRVKRCGEAASIAPGAITVLISDNNNGFAAGANIGLRALYSSRDIDHFLCLNPDAVAAAGAIAGITQKLENTEIGLCGATVLRATAPFPVQALGGADLHPFTLMGHNCGGELSFNERPDEKSIENVLRYPLGAAMACRRDYLDTVSFLDERYFLYYEEADWAFAGADRYRVGWARDAVFYHHHGAAAGSRLKPGLRAPLADYHMARSRFLFALKWRPELAPFLVAAGVAQSARRMLRGYPRQAGAVLRGSMPFAARRFSAA